MPVDFSRFKFDFKEAYNRIYPDVLQDLVSQLGYESIAKLPDVEYVPFYIQNSYLLSNTTSARVLTEYHEKLMNFLTENLTS